MFRFFLDALFPRRSVGGKAGAWVTGSELRQMYSFPMVLERGVLEGRGCRSIDRIVSATSLKISPLLRHALHRFKYGRVPGMGERLGLLLLHALPLLGDTSTAVLCPVPLHWTRAFHRGFNQSAVLAQLLSDYSSLPVRTLLRRKRATGFQARRDREQRVHALLDVFTSDARDVPAHVILIDDVSTTGATLDACAAALKKAGVERVEGLVVAIG